MPDNKYAIITGASSGIGRACATSLAEDGWDTFLVARRRLELEALASRLSYKHPSFAVNLDVTDRTAVNRDFELIQRGRNPPALLIIAAGYNEYLPYQNLTEEQKRRIFDTNFHGARHCIDAVLPEMLKVNRGHIIAVSSMSADAPAYGHSMYSAAKGALSNLMDALAVEHSNSNVSFTTVFPGIVKTDFFDHPSYANFSQDLLDKAIPVSRVVNQIMCAVDSPIARVTVPRHYGIIRIIKSFSSDLSRAILSVNTKPKKNRESPSHSSFSVEHLERREQL